MKTSELTGRLLDWAVAKCYGYSDYMNTRYLCEHRFSTDHGLGGPIIEREGIECQVHVIQNSVITSWAASKNWPNNQVSEQLGPTMLIAAMRCYVANRLGEEIEIPKELL